MEKSEYFKISPYVRTRMPGEIAEIMTDIAEGVVVKLGELSIARNIADELPPVQSALLMSAIQTPGFKMKAAKKRHQALAELPPEMVPYEKIRLEEMLYERGITAEWHVDQSVRRTSHELVIYYVNEQ